MRRWHRILYLVVAVLLLAGTASGQSQSSGGFEVVQALPATSSTDVASDSVLMVIFNRPVIPLTTSVDVAGLVQPLTIQPETAGHGEWVNTATYLFHPQDPLLPATTYTISVQAGLQAQDGTALAQTYSWTFTTATAEVLRIVSVAAPHDNDLAAPDRFLPGGHILLNPAFDVYFSQPVNRHQAESQFYIRTLDQIAGSAPGTFVWGDHSDVFTFRMTGRLDFNTTYRVGVDPHSGALPLTGQFEWEFTTVPLPAIVNVSPNDGAKGVGLSAQFWVSFASPMDADSFKDKITVEPEPQDKQEYYNYDAYSVSMSLSPRTTYTVTLAPGVKDLYGNVLNEGRTVTFTTGSVPPNLQYNINGRVAFYNAYNDMTGLYVNHINIDHLAMRLFRLPLDDAISLALGKYQDFAVTRFPNYSQQRPYLPNPNNLVRSEVIPLNDPLDRYQNDFLNLGEDGPLPPGVYDLNARVPANLPDMTSSDQPSITDFSHFLMVMTTNLTLKASAHTLWVWATDAKSGQTVSSAPISVYRLQFDFNPPGNLDAHPHLIGVGLTDSQGLLELHLPPDVDGVAYDSPLVAVLQTDTLMGMGATNWANGIDPGMFNQQTDFNPDAFRIYAYTDRPVYRPNQTVYFRAVVRSKDDVTYTQPALSSVPVQIHNSQGQVVFSQELPLTPFGTLNGQFQIGADVPLGYYYLSVSIPVGTSISQNVQQTVGFSVAEYRLPEFDVQVTPQADQVAPGDTLRVAMSASYYSGGPLSDAVVDYTITATPAYFHYTGRDYYSFGDYSDEDRYGQSIGSGSGTADHSGSYLLEQPVNLEDRQYPQVYNIEANIRGDTGQTVSGRTQVLVHPAKLYVGARPDRYVTRAGDNAPLHLIAVDWDSQPIANQTIHVEVVEKRWSNVQQMDDQGHTTWTWQVQTIPVTTGQVTTDADGKADYSFTPPNAGIFQVNLTSLDQSANTARTAITLWVTGSQYVSWQQQNSDRIDLIADQNSYHVGDTADILITSPFQGTTKALITVERAGVMHIEVVTMDTNSYVYHLPITPDFAPNVFVSVMLVKGVDEHNLVTAFRMGLIQLQVDAEQKQITVQLTADHSQAAPQETVHYTIHTLDYRGQPVQAEVGVGLTDAASLALADPNSPPLLDYYYQLQGLGVRTSTPLTMNNDERTQSTTDMLKGGGGGGGELGVIEVRENFLDTPYWNAVLHTNAQGEASFSVTLPDNLTTWRLDARAVTSGDDGLTLVGQNTLDLVSTRLLIIRPATPRFFVVGDTVTLAAVVNNNSSDDLQTEVWMQATGVTLQGSVRQTITIPAGGHQRIEWPATVNDVENVELIFYAHSGDYTDASRPDLGQGDHHLLPVYQYEAPETTATAGTLLQGGSRTEGIQLPENFAVEHGQLTVHIEPSLAATTLDGLGALQNYPYDCIEQTISKFLPNIITYRALANLGVDRPGLQASLQANVSEGLQRLYAFQKTDGGWGWFPQDASNPLTTAYALIALVEAQKQGFDVAPDTIARAKGFLQATFVVADRSTPFWQLNRQVFVLYALARAGAPDVARTSNLYDLRERLNLDARAFLAQTLHMIDPNDNRANTLLSDLVNVAAFSATGTHWEEGWPDYWNWTTDTRSSAIVLDTLVTLTPDSPLIPDVIRWLVTQRTGTAWYTTQETVWSVMALTDWMVHTGELRPDYTYQAAINGTTLTQGAATAQNVTESVDLSVQVSDLLAGQLNRLVIQRDDGPGALYYTAYLHTLLPVPEIQPFDRGIIIQRTYTRLDDTSGAQADQARVGDIIQVHLTVVAPNDLYYVHIEDPIPAGAEAIDPGLNTNQQVGVQPTVSRTDPFEWGWGWWWFSHIEFQDDKTVLYSSYLPAGTYEYIYTFRATVPGVYNVIPATGQEFYFPEVYGRSAGSTFTVLPPQT